MPRFRGQTVLVLCTANRCRSPLTAALLVDRGARADLAWTVETAGVRTRPGGTTEPEVLTVLGEIGIAREAATVRPLDTALLRVADVVLTAERAHRSAVLERYPALVGRAFTLLEFARLLAAAAPPAGPVERLTDLAQHADSARAVAGAVGDDDDLADPIGHSVVTYRDCRAVVDHAVGRIIAACG